MLPLLSARLNEELPPIAVRLHATAIPVEGGSVPAVMLALSVVPLPAVTGLGLAEPEPLGLVGSPVTWGAKATQRNTLLALAVQSS